jgi:hypothetical protein
LKGTSATFTVVETAVPTRPATAQLLSEITINKSNIDFIFYPNVFISNTITL